MEAQLGSEQMTSWHHMLSCEVKHLEAQGIDPSTSWLSQMWGYEFIRPMNPEGNAKNNAENNAANVDSAANAKSAANAGNVAQAGNDHDYT